MPSPIPYLADSLESGRTGLPTPRGSVRLWETELAPAVGFDPETDRSFKGTMGHVDVPADHAEPSGPSFRLRFARFKARAGADGLPVFYLFGGPVVNQELWSYLDGGQPNALSRLAETVTEHADLIVIDHRGGFGCAFPTLIPVPIHEAMPLDRCVSLAEREEHYGTFFGKQIDFWGSAGINLAHFRTPQLARDIEAIRLALGYDKIRISGISNGTYRAREYLRQFQHNVDSALLLLSHGYHKLPSSLAVYAALKRIDCAVAGDRIASRHMTSLIDVLDELSSQLERSSVRVPVSSQALGQTDVQLDHADLNLYVWKILGNASEIRSAPAKIWNIYHHRDYSDLAKSAVAARRLGMGPNISEIGGANGASAYVAAFAGSSMPTSASVAQNAADAGNRGYLNRQCEGGESSCAWPLERDDHSQFHHKIPIVYVQGEWDIRTPIEGVSAVGGNSKIIVNSAMGHGSGSEYDRRPNWWQNAMQAFLTDRLPSCYDCPSDFSSPLFSR